MDVSTTTIVHYIRVGGIHECNEVFPCCERLGDVLTCDYCPTVTSMIFTAFTITVRDIPTIGAIIVRVIGFIVIVIYPTTLTKLIVYIIT
jgi:hypothetical protein